MINNTTQIELRKPTTEEAEYIAIFELSKVARLASIISQEQARVLTRFEIKDIMLNTIVIANEKYGIKIFVRRKYENIIIDNKSIQVPVEPKKYFLNRQNELEVIEEYSTSKKKKRLFRDTAIV